MKNRHTHCRRTRVLPNLEQLESRVLLAADSLEPNNTAATATDLGAADFIQTGLTIDPGDVDWYQVKTTIGGTLKVDIAFQHIAGDLDLELFDANLARIAFSDSITNNESISRQVNANESFFIRVFGFGVGSNNYDLSVDTPNLAFPQDALEPNDSKPAATNIGSGDQVRTNLTIHGSNNDDWYQWTAPSDGPLTVETLFSHQTGNLDLQVFDVNNNLLASSTSVNDNEQVQLAAASGQQFFFRVFGVAGATHDNYTLSVNGPELIITADSLEPNDSMFAAADLGTGDREIKDLNIHQAGNDDYYRWTSPLAGEVVIDVSFIHAFGDLDLEVFDATGSQLALESSLTNNETVKLNSSAGDVFVIRVFGVNGARHPSYDVKINGPDITSDASEPNNTFDTATDLGSGDRQLDDLSINTASDQDYFKWTAIENGNLTIDLDFTHATGNIDVELRDAANRVVAASRSLTDGEHIALNVLAGEKYVIHVFGANDALQGDYSLIVDGPIQQADQFENNDEFSSPADLGTGDQFHTDLTLHQSFDDDWYKWTALEDGDFEASIFFNGALGDLDLELYDADQNLLDESTSVTNTEQVQTTVSAGQMVFLHVFGFGDAVQRNYDLAINSAGPSFDDAEPNDSIDAAYDLGTGDQTFVGTIHLPGNEDWYQWTASGEGRVDVDLVFQHAAGNVDLEVYDRSGVLLDSSTSTDDNESLSFMVMSDEMLFIRVLGANDETQDAYELTIDGNDPPTISNGGNHSINEDTGLTVPFTVMDDQTPAEDIQVTASSSDSSVIPDTPGNLILSGTGEIRALNVVPAVNASGLATITISATDSTGGTTLHQFDVMVVGVADEPNLTVSNANGVVDTAIPLDVSASLTDTDGSETLSIMFSGVPDGATLSAGAPLGAGSYLLTPEDLVGLTVTPPSQDTSPFSMVVTATATESDSGSIARATATLDVTVLDATGAPSLKVTESVAGNEDTTIPLSISASTVPEAEDTLTIDIAGVPNGAILSAGTDNGDGSYTLTPEQLAGLTVTPLANSDDDFSLAVTATATLEGTPASTTAEIRVNVDAVADPPTLQVVGAAGAENTAVPLDIAAALVDQDGSETLEILIENVPAGAVLSNGVEVTTGIWSLLASELAELTITPPADSDADFELNVSAIATETQNGTSAVTNSPLSVVVSAMADLPTLTVSDTAGDEDASIPLSITAEAASELDTLTVEITGLPAGGILSAGTNDGDGTWVLSPEDLPGLSVIAPNYDMTFVLNVTAIATNTTSGNTAAQSATLTVEITPINDAPVHTVPASQTTSEDGSLLFSSDAGNLIRVDDVDLHGGSIGTIVIVNEGTITLASTDGLSVNGNGSGAVTLSGTLASVNAALNGLLYRPNPNFSGSDQLRIISDDLGNTGTGGRLTDSDALEIVVTGTNDPPVITSPSEATVDAGVTTVMTVTATDPEGEAVTFAIDGGADQAQFVINNITGTLAFLSPQTPDDPQDANADNVYEVIVRATDASNASATRALLVSVVALDEPPVVDVQEVDPEVRAAKVEEITIEFNEAVNGVTKDNLTLTRQDDATATVSLAGATLSTTDNRVWSLADLGGVTADSGIYRLSLTPAGITDGTGNALVAGDEISWINGPGDANRDNKFDQADVVRMLQGAKYRTGAPATWSEGDFNGDGVFDQSDVILALQPAHYLMGSFEAQTAESVMLVEPSHHVAQFVELSRTADEIPSVEHEAVLEDGGTAAVPSGDGVARGQVTPSDDEEMAAVDLLMQDDWVRLI